MLRLCVDSYIISAPRATFRKFCASESSIPNDGTEQVIPCESSGPHPLTEHIPELRRLIGMVYKIEQHSESEARRSCLGIEQNSASSPEKGRVSLS